MHRAINIREVNIKSKCYLLFLSEGKDQVICNVQLCLTFNRISVMLTFLWLPLC